MVAFFVRMWGRENEEPKYWLNKKKKIYLKKWWIEHGWCIENKIKNKNKKLKLRLKLMKIKLGVNVRIMTRSIAVMKERKIKKMEKKRKKKLRKKWLD